MCAVEGKLSTNTLLAMPYRLIADRANRAGRDFLQIDSEIGLTFSGIALAANDDEKRRRTTRSARKAYDSIERLRNGVELTDTEQAELDRNLLRLKRELQSLGETF